MKGIGPKDNDHVIREEWKEGTSILEKTAKKKFLNKITIQIIWFFYALCSIALVLYLIDHMFSKEIEDKEKRLVLEDGWTVSINGTQYDDVILDELRFEKLFWIYIMILHFVRWKHMRGHFW